ncbi:flagellar export protein FliJ [Weizmannia acidilactici]|uniref:flagellar export protein FliJ n=1 Tax=Weizmannia acidilactici TaxID=2607726 RepID=UPI00124D22D7|nr:flagellar export protein FliJ [Weizmannia acidilactici]GER71981.1 flagellar FliJ protein [Weizmannia acidilactici]
MNYQYKFEKILDVKEREKDQALSAYQNAIRAFENVARELYTLLKKKEDLESYQAEKMASGLSVQKIRHYRKFIDDMEKTINHYQQLVVKARNQMNWYQQKLQEKNIEVKKYEKMRDKDYSRFLEKLKMLEEKQADEISTQAFFRKS